MTTPSTTGHAPVTATEIAELLAWCRRLTQTRPQDTDPAEIAAYQQAKAALLARLTTTATEGPTP